MSFYFMTPNHWKQKLTPEQYHVMREGKTEPPFSGKYLQEKSPGVYVCAACGQALFSATTKFDSGSGWPSFWQAVDSQAVTLRLDKSHGMRRTEVVCPGCGSHLGHVFDDGPAPTGQRFCINSVALELKKSS